MKKRSQWAIFSLIFFATACTSSPQINEQDSASEQSSVSEQGALAEQNAGPEQNMGTEQGPGSEKSLYLDKNGPFFHEIYTIESTDGLTWKQSKTEPLAEHASVPDVGMIGDRMMVYYVDASTGTETLGCMYSDDEGKTFKAGQCSLEGTPTQRNADFSFVSEDGEWRLYYYAMDLQSQKSSDHAIRYATTTDGFTFTDAGEVFAYPGLVDPDVFYNGSEWILHVFSLTDGKTLVATSQDGMQFSDPTAFEFPHFGLAKPISVSGGFRMYAFKQGEQTSIYSFFSKDGLSWTQEEGVRWEAPEGYEITDPSVVQLPNGTYKMVYKISAKPTENGKQQ